MAKLTPEVAELPVYAGYSSNPIPPIAAPASTEKPGSDLIPVQVTFPVLKPAPAASPVTGPGGCGGGGCPLATPPTGGSVTITRTDATGTPAAAAAFTGGKDAGLGVLTQTYAGFPLWVWLLVAFLALVAISK